MRIDKVKTYAKKMRNNPTPSEKEFWELVRKRKLLGLMFNRQFIFSHVGLDDRTHFYIVDFYCHELKLVVEIDGAYHDNSEQIELDEMRTETLELLGLSIIRFSNDLVLQNSEKVLQLLRIEIAKIDNNAK